MASLVATPGECGTVTGVLGAEGATPFGVAAAREAGPPRADADATVVGGRPVRAGALRAATIHTVAPATAISATTNAAVLVNLMRFDLRWSRPCRAKRPFGDLRIRRTGPFLYLSVPAVRVAPEAYEFRHAHE
jgi:hypothetical protein